MSLSSSVHCLRGPSFVAACCMTFASLGNSLLPAQDDEERPNPVDAVRSSVFLVGTPNGSRGTAFVISQEHRLLATNAHVADIGHEAEDFLAIQNETSHIFRVDQIWYHPGLLRIQGDELVMSMNPAEGESYGLSPDVAVLHLSGDDPLPPAIPMAIPEELDKLFASPVFMLGFPGHDTERFPKFGEEVSATYRRGEVVRSTDFEFEVPANDSDKQLVQYDMKSWAGFSGSAVMLANGHLAALHNAGDTIENPLRAGRTVNLAWGIRVDCLWELLAYHKLDDKVLLPIDKSELRLDRFKESEKELVNSIGMKLVLIRPGRFRMGRSRSDKGRDVRITKPYYAGAYEVTEGEYFRVMGELPELFQDRNGRKPVRYISWNEAIQFCNALSELEGLPPYYRRYPGRDDDDDRRQYKVDRGPGYRLPTEAEWEYAARANSSFPFNRQSLSKYAVFDREIGSSETVAPVGTKAPNPWGLYDVIGNVREYCFDEAEWWGSGDVQFDDLPAADDPIHLESERDDQGCITRGCDWYGLSRFQGADCITEREPERTGYDSDKIGLRVFRTHPAATEWGRIIPPAENPQKTNSIGMKFRLIPEGAFTMLAGETRAYKEMKQHQEIPRPFYLGAHEVTQRQYARLMGANPSAHQDSPDLPVDSVLFVEAASFCNALSQSEGLVPFYTFKVFRNGHPVISQQGMFWSDEEIEDVSVSTNDGNGYRLPTPQEWQYACRAGTDTSWYWGEEWRTSTFHAWTRSNSESRTHKVGQKRHNPWGLFDMHGNVAELCHHNWIDGDGWTLGGSFRGFGLSEGGFDVRYYYDDIKKKEHFRRLNHVGFRVAQTHFDELPEPFTPENRTVRNSLQMKLVEIPAGEFSMGHPDFDNISDQYDRDSTQPSRRVRINSPFYLGAYEVTHAQFFELMSTDSYYRDENDPRIAEVGPTIAMPGSMWTDAIEFCNRLSAKEKFPPYYKIETVRAGELPSISILGGNGYRLPTEAEWEYACRAGTSTEYFFGEDSTFEFLYVNCFGSPIGSRRCNPWGLYDMCGNVGEWCWDAWSRDSSPGLNLDFNPDVKQTHRRIVRDFYSDPVVHERYGSDVVQLWKDKARFTQKGREPFFYSSVGFRVARTIVPGQ